MSNVEIEAQNKTPPKRLFKYLAPDRFDGVFVDQKIRFSQPSVLNDPFELKPSINSIEFERENKKDLYKHKIRAVIDEGFCKISVLCVCEKPKNLLMWAHYAQNHKGFVLELNPQHEFFNLPNIPEQVDYYANFKKVDYIKFRPKIEPHKEGDLRKNLISSLFKKSIHWKYEKEWRILMRISLGDKVEPDIYLFPLELSAIKRIILGCNADETLEKKARALKDREETKYIVLEKAEVDLHEFKLNFKALKS